MNLESVISQLKQIITEKLDVNLKLEEIDIEISLFEDGLGFDSVIIVEFISLIEKHFCFKFSSEELDIELFTNLKILSNFIYKKIKLSEL